MTLVDILRSSVKKYPHAPAVTIKRGFRVLTLSYVQLYELSQKIACFLAKSGIQPGENIVILAPNSPYLVSLFFGVLMRGCRIVPLTIQSQPEFVLKALAQTEAKVFFKYTLFTAAIPSSISVFDIDFIDELVADCNIKDFKIHEVSKNDLAQILYTSGTTGEPKGVMLTHANMASNICSIAELIHPESGKDRLLSILPLSHILEQTIGLFLPIYKGVQVIYTHSPAAIAELMNKYRITKMVAVPEFLQVIRSRILGAIDKKHLTKLFNWLMCLASKINARWFSRILFKFILNQFGGELDTIASGGAPLDPELELWWNHLGVIILQGYGLTETSPTVTTNTYEIHRFASVGKTLRDVDVHIADDGEILVKGPNVSQGYYKNEEKTRDTFDSDGWFHTGDMGEFDQDKFLFLRGRKKYMILGPGGQNVFPEDLEGVLRELSGVTDAAVLGLESHGGSVTIHAVLLLKKDAPHPRDIIARANKKLASYQQITDWSIWPETDFPRSATRKVKKEEVRKYLEGQKKATVAGPSVSPLVRLLAQVSGVQLSSINQNSLLVSDLHIDSLKRVELLARIEQDFSVAIDETAITAETTIHALQELIDKKEQIKAQPKLARWPRWWISACVRFLLQELFFLISRLFLWLKVEGLENIRDIRDLALFMPNHLSNWDPVVLARALPWRIRWRLSFSAAKDVVYEQFWYVSWLSELSFNCFPLPRQEGTQIKVGLENVGQMLDWHQYVAIFPEGKMSLDGNLLPLKEGAGLVATQMGVPVVPVRIYGITKIFPYDTFLPRSWGRVRVVFGKPMSFSRRLPYQEVTKQIYEAIKDL